MTHVPKVQTIAKGATPSKLLGGVAVVALLGAFGAPTAAVADTASEIKALKAELKRLEHRLEEQAKTTHQVKNALNSAKSAPDHKGPPPVFVSFKNGLFVETEDKDFNFKVGGRIQIDGGFTSYPSSGSRSNVDFRRARLEVEGKAYKNWYYKFQYDFTGSGSQGIRDAFLAYRAKLLPSEITSQPVTFQVGSQYEPFSMETVTSSKHITFIERALPGALAPDRHIGARVGLGDKHWAVQAGVFSTSFGQDKAQNPAATGHQYWDLTTRAIYAPIVEEDKLLHFGGSFMYHKPNDSTAAQDPNNLLPGSGSRDETDILKNTYIVVPSAQALNCSPAYKAATGVALLWTPGYLQNGCLKSSYNYNFEMAATYGPFSVQGEYTGAHYERDAGTALALGNNGGSSLEYSGYYVQGSVFLTGESRAASYKGYDKDWNSPGTFSDIAIKNPLGKGGWGAWEIAARYSELNLNNGGLVDSNYAYLAAVAGNAAQKALANTATLGGREENLTLALNWYPVRGVRLQANWTRAMTLVAPSDKPYLNGQHPSTFLFRTQVFW
ncbi:OprO/OprP family phosphate-selective porin [Methylosinus sp. RM1]|uniref:OprO/OprP family phosphate-selective porin n=1 Tax=Methylosinus sp. RM1 TaxID=2583817 RepID=UPI00140DEF14|nr:porin [Methylosinus sp. RM1]